MAMDLELFGIQKIGVGDKFGIDIREEFWIWLKKERKGCGQLEQIEPFVYGKQVKNSKRKIKPKGQEIWMILLWNDLIDSFIVTNIVFILRSRKNQFTFAIVDYS